MASANRVFVGMGQEVVRGEGSTLWSVCSTQLTMALQRTHTQNGSLSMLWGSCLGPSDVKRLPHEHLDRPQRIYDFIQKWFLGPENQLQSLLAPWHQLGYGLPSWWWKWVMKTTGGWSYSGPWGCISFFIPSIVPCTRVVALLLDVWGRLLSFVFRLVFRTGLMSTNYGSEWTDFSLGH